MKDKTSSKDWKKEFSDLFEMRSDPGYILPHLRKELIINFIQKLLLEQNAEANKSCQKVVEKALKEQREEITKELEDIVSLYDYTDHSSCMHEVRELIDKIKDK